MATAQRYPVMLGVRVSHKLRRQVVQLRRGDEKMTDTLRRLLYAGISATLERERMPPEPETGRDTERP